MTHRDTDDNANMLSRGQVVEMEINYAQVVDVPLRAGEMSIHHVRLVHGSTANTSDERRVGFAIRYIPTNVRQLVGRSSATLVRGDDFYMHFIEEPVPRENMDLVALEFYEEEFKRQQEVLYRGASPEKAEKFVIK
jgi:ectoine hydroxylase-related dioxygenase (phytanoyl-CoA dioxygenase family)